MAIKILIADDEPNIVISLEFLLKREGYEVVVAHDGVQALERIRSERPDMAIHDVMMPHRNGFEVCQEIKKTAHGKRTPVIVTTGVYKGRRYRTVLVGARRWVDRHDDYLGFLAPRLVEARRLLKPDGSLFVHLDYREVHHVKVLLDAIFGRRSFVNEIIWAYDYGGRPKNRWPAKHDTILWYALDPDDYVFDFDAIDRIPYMAPDLVGKEKAERGKTPTDVWFASRVRE